MCATLYERGGSLNVIVEPARGGSSSRGATSVGCSNVFAALRSAARERLAGEDARTA